MNQKQLKYAALMLLFTFINPSFGMYRAIFKAARTVGMATGPACGLYLFNEENKRSKKQEDEFWKKSPLISETVVEAWGKEKMTELNVANAELMSFVYGFDWATCKEKFIIVPRYESYQLNKALKLKNKSSLGRFFYKIRFLGDDPDKTIACHSMALKHEIGHIINKDDQNRIYNLVTIPVAVETVSFGATYTFRKLCNIQQSKTFLKTMLRSCSAIGAIAPKALMSGVAYIFSKKYQEMRADTFACKNAESRLELEEFENLFQESINKRTTRENIIKENGVEDLMFFDRLTGRFDSMPRQYVECFKKGLQEIAGQLNDPSVSEQRKKILKDILQVVRNPDHPCNEKRVANVRKYIDKWDREHPGDEKRA